MSETLNSLMVFDGNCLSQHVAAIFQGGGLADAIFVGHDFGYLPSYRGAACRFVSEAEAERRVEAARQSGRMTYQVSQASQRAGAGTFSYTSKVHKVIKFPHVQFYAMAPGAFQAEYGRALSPKRLFDLDLQVVQACERHAESTVDIAGLMREQTTRTNLFHSVTHPSGLITSLKVRQVALQMDDLERSEWERVEKDVASVEAINFMSHHPLSIETYDSLGLDWPNYHDYRNLLVGEETQQWEAIRENSAQYFTLFGEDSRALLALIRMALALNDEGVLRVATENFLRLSPGFFHAWLLRFEYLLRFRSLDKLDVLLVQAKSFYGEHRLFPLIMAWINIHLGHLAEADPYARSWLSRAPDRADAIVPSLYVHVRGGESEKAAAAAIAYVRTRPMSELEMLRGFFRDIDGLNVGSDEIEGAIGSDYSAPVKS